MNKFKKVTAIGVMALAIGATSITAFASSNYKTPAETLAVATGKNVEDVKDVKEETGKCYGTIAKEEGKLEEFKKMRLDDKKEVLDSKVKSGQITQKEADEIINNMKQRQENCNGDGNLKKGGCMGKGAGKGMCNKNIN